MGLGGLTFFQISNKLPPPPTPVYLEPKSSDHWPHDGLLLMSELFDLWYPRASTILRERRGT